MPVIGAMDRLFYAASEGLGAPVSGYRFGIKYAEKGYSVMCDTEKRLRRKRRNEI